MLSRLLNLSSFWNLVADEGMCAHQAAAWTALNGLGLALVMPCVQVMSRACLCCTADGVVLAPAYALTALLCPPRASWPRSSEAGSGAARLGPCSPFLPLVRLHCLLSFVSRRRSELCRCGPSRRLHAQHVLPTAGGMIVNFLAITYSRREIGRYEVGPEVE